MRVSVICAVYNDVEAVRNTIESFINQQYENKRLIVIDGGSTDGTVELLKKYDDVIAYWSSEPDQGISDAFNKGLVQVEPGYVYFIGAGDSFANNFVIGKMMDGCDYQRDKLVCGKVRFVDEKTGNVKFIAPKTLKFKKSSLLFRMSLPHQGLFTSTAYFEEIGKFRLDCKYAMDYEILLRAYPNFPAVIMKDELVATWLAGGIGSGRTLEVFKEYDRIRRLNSVASGHILTMINALTVIKYKIKQLISYE